jgi:hypothetical protein
MANPPPDGLSVERSRDLQGRSGHVWYRRALLCVIAVLPILALLNVFGQRPTMTSAHTVAADLVVTAPARLRSGLIFQVRVRVTAHQDLAKPQLVFDPGWWESMSENSMAPNPSRRAIGWLLVRGSGSDVGRRRCRRGRRTCISTCRARGRTGCRGAPRVLRHCRHFRAPSRAQAERRCSCGRSKVEITVGLRPSSRGPTLRLLASNPGRGTAVGGI